MHPQAINNKTSRSADWIRRLLFLSPCLLCFATGCAALSNPVANGVPVRRLPPEILGESRENMQTIPLSMLRQPRPEHYILAPGDVLGVWIEGILGEKGQTPPVQVSALGTQPGSIGFPIPVRGNGTIAVPLVPPIKVEGMRLEQAEEAIRNAYSVDRKIIVPNRERIIVTLQRPREFHVLVIRQDASVDAGTIAGATGAAAKSTGFVLNVGGGTRGSRRGTGFAIDLPAYENDVLNALARTGGFPGTDAINEVIVERGSDRGTQIRIPLRYRPGQEPVIRPEDVILQTGDIVYIEAREGDVFYTAGLLPPGKYVLPRDTDLDVVQAIARASGSINAGGISTFNINGTLTLPGIGNPSPTLVSVLRQIPGGGQVNIRVDMDRALRDPRERIIIQPKDIILLQETPEEGIARYFSQSYRFNALYQLINSVHANVSTSAVSP